MRPIVIAIPARNEEYAISASLPALIAEAASYAGDVSIVIAANNCTDNTVSVSTAIAQTTTIPVHIAVMNLSARHANAGTARARTLALAAANACSPDTIIVTTDADTRPQPGWLAKISMAVNAGADAIAGSVDFEPSEAAKIRMPPIRQREAEYAGLQAELAALLDPNPHDPYPNHIWAWGANLAVTLDAYRKTGGVPEVPLAEDRAFVSRLLEVDCKVLHSLDIRVWTSPRTEGRAPGGVADLISIYAIDPDYPCDSALLPVKDIFRQASLRRQYRAAYQEEPEAPLTRLAARLLLSVEELDNALQQPFCGLGWANLVRHSPMLKARRVHPVSLEREILLARRALALLESPKTEGATAFIRDNLWSGFGNAH
ncbi:MAG: glycosyltransferase [Hyphomicrobiales bacterium]|nr:glycosyltransferase [Hyphomicrobiales bacterium]